MKDETNGGVTLLPEDDAGELEIPIQAPEAEPPEERPSSEAEEQPSRHKKERPKKEKKPRKAKAPAGGKKRGSLARALKHYSADKDQIVRIEQLQAALADENSELDPDALISMYMPHRKLRRLAAALLRVDRLQLTLLSLVLVVAILFIMAFMQEKMGNFTINLNRLELYRRGIAIAADGNFTDPTARLTADTVKDATNISIDDLPTDVNDVDGNHNGKNYMAYTYYVRNAGKEDLPYRAFVKLESAAKGAEEAVRVAVWRNNERVVYAAPAADGGDEDGCTSFYDGNIVCQYQVDNFRVGDVDKYTIVIWMEGDDPECVDKIVGGSVQFSMNIDSEYENKTNLLVKFIQDIKDTLTGDRPITAAGTDVPDYYLENTINYYNRRNQ